MQVFVVKLVHERTGKTTFVSEGLQSITPFIESAHHFALKHSAGKVAAEYNEICNKHELPIGALVLPHDTEKTPKATNEYKLYGHAIYDRRYGRFLSEYDLSKDDYGFVFSSNAMEAKCFILQSKALSIKTLLVGTGLFPESSLTLVTANYLLGQYYASNNSELEERLTALGTTMRAKRSGQLTVWEKICLRLGL